ncbi:MAG: malonate decarboxylase holo-ACP synthase [Clostridium perfringens]|nr:malonate decarboxylase holo-ACP synthase [Clostridium perfringens]
MSNVIKNYYEKNIELKPHDIIKVKDINKIIENIKDSKWIEEALRKAPFVVVRRGEFINGDIPIGIRGATRDERYGTYLKKENILEAISPEKIAQKRLWLDNNHIKMSKIFNALEIVNDVLKDSDLKWGPTGSTAFELVSNIETINENSDLDILIKTPNFLAVESAKEINEKLQKVPCKMDVQLEVPKGIIALVEYARGDNPILLRTNKGYSLVKDPWEEGK